MRQLFHLLLLMFPLFAQAQNMTGVWEGIMDDEFLQINIEQKDSILCGYTYDHVLLHQNDYCRATFSGSFDHEKKKWSITGEQFLENAGNHMLMRLTVWMKPLVNDTLWVKVEQRSFVALLLNIQPACTYLVKQRNYTDISHRMRPCFPPRRRKPKPVIAKDTIPAIITTTTTTSPNDSATVLQQMKIRKQTTQTKLVVNADHINLKLYDNGVVDNDTISIFYNGKLLISHQRLSEKAVELNIKLDENVNLHEITLFAENLGGIPPNTALVIITAGDKRYELRSSANLEENAVLVFEYVPVTK